MMQINSLNANLHTWGSSNVCKLILTDTCLFMLTLLRLFKKYYLNYNKSNFKCPYKRIIKIFVCSFRWHESNLSITSKVFRFLPVTKIQRWRQFTSKLFKSSYLQVKLSTQIFTSYKNTKMQTGKTRDSARHARRRSSFDAPPDTNVSLDINLILFSPTFWPE